MEVCEGEESSSGKGNAREGFLAPSRDEGHDQLGEEAIAVEVQRRERNEMWPVPAVPLGVKVFEIKTVKECDHMGIGLGQARKKGTHLLNRQSTASVGDF